MISRRSGTPLRPICDSSQRIVRILVHEIVADVDEKSSEVVLLLHWAGGRHSELRIKKNATGKHRRCTAVETIDVIRQMAGRFPDEQIATTLNRLDLRTGTGHTWNEGRVKSARNYHKLPTYDLKRQDGRILTLEQVALRLGISTASVRRMIEQKTLPAAQVVACAPWQISEESLETEAVRKAVRNIKTGVRRPRTHVDEQQPSMFSGV